MLLFLPQGAEGDTFNNDPGAFKVLCSLDLVPDNPAHDKREQGSCSGKNCIEKLGFTHILLLVSARI
jgi:hypothetical protein